MLCRSCRSLTLHGVSWLVVRGFKKYYQRGTILTRFFVVVFLMRGVRIQAKILMAFRWRVDDGPTLNAGLVDLSCFKGLWPVLLRNPILLRSFRGGGGGVRTPCTLHWIRAWVGRAVSWLCSLNLLENVELDNRHSGRHSISSSTTNNQFNI